MTPRQMYRELSKLTRIIGLDGEPLLVSRKFGPSGLDELTNGMLCLLEKLDASRARHDFARAYARRRQRRDASTQNVDGTAQEEDPLRGLMPDMIRIDESQQVRARRGWVPSDISENGDMVTFQTFDSPTPDRISEMNELLELGRRLQRESPGESPLTATEVGMAIMEGRPRASLVNAPALREILFRTLGLTPPAENV